jgi:transcriptional regulator with XRE-family HTH domain
MLVSVKGVCVVKGALLRTAPILASQLEAAMPHIGEKIQALRTAKGWTQEDFAKKMHTTASAVSRWEAGRIVPSGETLAEWAKLFDVTVDYFLFDDVPRQPRGGLKDPELRKQMEQIDDLDAEARAGFKRFLKALIAEKMVKEALAHSK